MIFQDSYLHLLQYDLCFAEFDSLLISHWHSDHFYGEDLAYRMSGYALDIPNRLTVYGNEAVKTFYQRAFDLEGRQDDTRLQYQVIQPYKCFTIANYTIYPLPAQHGNFSEDCFIFVIDDGKDAFYPPMIQVTLRQKCLNILKRATYFLVLFL